MKKQQKIVASTVVLLSVCAEMTQLALGDEFSILDACAKFEENNVDPRGDGVYEVNVTLRIISDVTEV